MHKKALPNSIWPKRQIYDCVEMCTFSLFTLVGTVGSFKILHFMMMILVQMNNCTLSTNTNTLCNVLRSVGLVIKDSAGRPISKTPEFCHILGEAFFLVIFCLSDSCNFDMKSIAGTGFCIFGNIFQCADVLCLLLSNIHQQHTHHSAPSLNYPELVVSPSNLIILLGRHITRASKRPPRVSVNTKCLQFIPGPGQ